MKNSLLGLVLLASAVLAGCAHPMTMKPNLGALPAEPLPASERIQRNVGLYIPDADRMKQVTTKGGGGDKVTYSPYADLETGLYKVLGDVFMGVRVLATPTDTESITKYKLFYIVQPEITTTSSSSGVLTWMATDFSVAVTCKFNQPGGENVAVVSATGIGKASSEEVSANFSVAGERASQDALIKLRTALAGSAELRK